MKASKLLRATATAAGAGAPLRPPPMAILPPLPLYRRILRSHRKHLPVEMRVLGDKYVKKEFKDHKSAENPLHIIGFLSEWQMYAQKIEGDLWKGEKLEKEKIDKMSDQQIGQLHELMQAIQKGEHGDGEGGAA